MLEGERKRERICDWENRLEKRDAQFRLKEELFARKIEKKKLFAQFSLKYFHVRGLFFLSVKTIQYLCTFKSLSAVTQQLSSVLSFKFFALKKRESEMFCFGFCPWEKDWFMGHCGKSKQKQLNFAYICCRKQVK